MPETVGRFLDSLTLFVTRDRERVQEALSSDPGGRRREGCGGRAENSCVVPGHVTQLRAAEH